MSAIPNSQARPVQPKYLSIPACPQSLSHLLIIDGKIIHENLTYVQKDVEWLTEQLLAFSISDVNDIFVAQLDSSGNLSVHKKNQEPNIPSIF